MSTIRVFDPPMCCSTGICGPAIDAPLARFAADLGWLKRQGVSVERFNLSQQPAAFVEDAAVRAALESRGEVSLPLVKVDGDIKSSGSYPSRDALAAWAGIALPPSSPEEPKATSVSGCASAETGLRVPSSRGCCSPASADAGQKKPGCC